MRKVWDSCSPSTRQGLSRETPIAIGRFHQNNVQATSVLESPLPSSLDFPGVFLLTNLHEPILCSPSGMTFSRDISRYFLFQFWKSIQMGCLRARAPDSIHSIVQSKWIKMAITIITWTMTVIHINPS